MRQITCDTLKQSTKIFAFFSFIFFSVFFSHLFSFHSFSALSLSIRFLLFFPLIFSIHGISSVDNEEIVGNGLKLGIQITELYIHTFNSFLFNSFNVRKGSDFGNAQNRFSIENYSMYCVFIIHKSKKAKQCDCLIKYCNIVLNRKKKLSHIAIAWIYKYDKIFFCT